LRSVVVSLTPPPKGSTTLDLRHDHGRAGTDGARRRRRDESGAGLSGMHVRLADPSDETTSLAQFRTSLDDGRFAFAGVAPGKHVVRVSGVGPDPMETKSEIDVPRDTDPGRDHGGVRRRRRRSRRRR
jgi:hypothetical protein